MNTADQLLTDNLAECLRAALASEEARNRMNPKRAEWVKSARVALGVYDARQADKAAKGGAA